MGLNLKTKLYKWEPLPEQVDPLKSGVINAGRLSPLRGQVNLPVPLIPQCPPIVNGDCFSKVRKKSQTDGYYNLKRDALGLKAYWPPLEMKVGHHLSPNM